MTDIIRLSIPAKAQNTLAIRLLVAGLANLYRFDSDEIEDLKLAVCEACTICPEGDYNLQLTFQLEEERLQIDVDGPPVPRKPMLGLKDAAEEGIGFLLMQNLMDSMEFKSCDDGTTIRLIKNVKSSVPVRSS